MTILMKRLLLKADMGKLFLASNGGSGNFRTRHISTTETQNKELKPYASLPKLPVPEPTKTLKHFLDFIQPLQSKKEFLQTKQVVERFANDELPKLQKLLQERATKQNNWLTPWWLDVAYLSARTPLPVVTSPGVMFPQFDFNGENGQIEYAAKITQTALQFYERVMSHELPQDVAGKVPFDMSQYKFLFGTTRIPRKTVDEVRYGISNENRARHILVISNGNYFAVDVLGKDGNILPLETIKSSFLQVAQQARERNTHPIGVVSSDNRDKWAATYETLNENPQNASCLEAIENALFVICLDQPTEPLLGYSAKDEQARQALHGGGVKKNSGNRWFDKTIQFVIGQNGFCGMTYEHTPAEGPPVASLMDFVCDQIKKEAFVSGPDSEVVIKKLEFELTDSNKKQVEKSGKKIDLFGKNFPKKVKISPDSFIQMAFQLAFYRIHSSVGPAYETATLRKFSEGRTENVRSPNTFAQIFVKKMISGRSPIPEIFDALKTACDSHKKYTVDCMNGAGMDRHLLAWNLLASENGLQKPSILNTDAYENLAHFQISTSQVPTRNFIQMCFGPSAPDCYGICYNPQETELHFTISTFKSHGSTSSKRFAKELEKALHDMHAVCNKAMKEQAKL